MQDDFEREEQDPRRYYSDSAYTSPAQSEGKKPEEKRREGKKRTVAAAIALVITVSCAAAAVYVAANYRIVMENDGGIELHFYRKDHVDIDLDGVHADSSGAEENGGDETRPQPTEAPTKWNGATLNIRKSGGEESSLSTAQIYHSCAAYVASVTGADKDGSSTGSGVIMSDDGYIITACRIVDGAETVGVTLHDGSSYDAQLVGEDTASGLAVIKIDASHLKAAEFCDDAALTVGQRVTSIANPFAGSFSLIEGIISSGVNKIRNGGFMLSAFQTSAQCGSGSAGSPVINEYGQIVGIINMSVGEQYGLENLAFALPVSMVKPIVEELLAKGYVSGRPALGMKLVDIPLSASAYYGMPRGVFVDSVYENTNAYEKGITHGDIIVSANGEKISSLEELNVIKNALAVGDTIELGIYRSRNVYTVRIVLADLADINDQTATG